MLAAKQQPVLGPNVPAAVVVLLAAAGVAVWVLLHLVKRRIASQRLWAALFALRIGAGFMAMLAGLHLIQYGLVLATDWPIWPMALLGAAAVEVLLLLYALERRTVSRKASAALAGLRVGLLLLVLCVLTQPTRFTEWKHELTRHVVVLVDDSASMHVADTHWPVSEKLRLGEMLGIDVAQRPYRLDESHHALDAVRRKLDEALERLSLAERDRARRGARLVGLRAALHETVADARRVVAEQIPLVARPLAEKKVPLDRAVVRALRDAKARLASPVGDGLERAARITEAERASQLARQYGRLRGSLSSAAGALKRDILPAVAEAGRSLDAAFFASLPAEKRGQIDAATRKTRAAIARDVLFRGSDEQGGAGLVERLEEKYKLKVYTFAASVTEADAQGWRMDYRAGAGARPGDDVSALPDEQQKTDLTAALRKIRTDFADKQLSGIVILTDGLHNGPEPIESLGGVIAPGGASICSVLVGSATPPRDAAVVSAEAPDVVFAKDKVHVSADLKLDGLAGRKAKVTLWDGGEAVDAETVTVPHGAATHRARVELTHRPEAGGVHPCRIEVQAFDDEVFPTNNSYPVPFAVRDDHARLLIVEGRPRWEFRYLKNLFADRDRTVKLQYVLLEPDRIAGAEAKDNRRIPACASRDERAVEATALPGNVTARMRGRQREEEILREWMKFDVVILGDVAPRLLRGEDLKAIQEFVTKRGGTLVVIAGRRYMPAAYAGTDVPDLLPVVFDPVAGGSKGQPRDIAAPEDTFHVALTAEGCQSIIMRQSPHREESLRIWDSLPPLYWRYPIVRTKTGATTLAYALPADPPDYMTAKAGSGDEHALARRREFEDTHALLSVHNVAAGRVMFLAFDRTWRLRYRVGDTRHHKFWGQVLRWATADKLPAGSRCVRLGTDQTRYAPDDDIRVRAMIVRPDFTPVRSDSAFVKVYFGDRFVLRRKLRYLPHSAGRYEADLGTLPGGSYRVELECPEAAGILAADKASGLEKVAVGFAVEPRVPDEQVRLAADRGGLDRLAAWSRGVVTDPPGAANVLQRLGKGTELRYEKDDYTLWDSWPLLVLILAVATSEWLLRKRVGLP
jgi:hypothetical protein